MRFPCINNIARVQNLTGPVINDLLCEMFEMKESIRSLNKEDLLSNGTAHIR